MLCFSFFQLIIAFSMLFAYMISIGRIVLFLLSYIALYNYDEWSMKSTDSKKVLDSVGQSDYDHRSL